MIEISQEKDKQCSKGFSCVVGISKDVIVAVIGVGIGVAAVNAEAVVGGHGMMEVGVVVVVTPGICFGGDCESQKYGEMNQSELDGSANEVKFEMTKK